MHVQCDKRYKFVEAVRSKWRSTAKRARLLLLTKIREMWFRFLSSVRIIVCKLTSCRLHTCLRRNVVYWNPNGRSSMISCTHAFCLSMPSVSQKSVAHIPEKIISLVLLCRVLLNPKCLWNHQRLAQTFQPVTKVGLSLHASSVSFCDLRTEQQFSWLHIKRFRHDKRPLGFNLRWHKRRDDVYVRTYSLQGVATRTLSPRTPSPCCQCGRWCTQCRAICSC